MIMARSITHIIKYEQLKLQNHFLEMLTATISHDMRTPLNAILGIGKNLEPHVTHEAGSRYLQIMMNSASLLHFLVNDLLDLFRIKNGKFSKHETKIDIRQHLNELIDIFQLQASEKGLELMLFVDESIPQSLIIDV
jgi:signal transduction histidine kinase